MSNPNINGSMRNPELVGLAPYTSWRNTGRNTIAPNMAIPTANPIVFATLNTLERKSESGTIGSAARVSHQRKTARSATPVSNVAPSTSILCRTVGVRRCNRVITITTASAPTGMLT